MTDPRAPLLVAGIGNPLAGDDGAGIAALRRLQPRWGDDPRLVLQPLHGDLFALGDLLPWARHLVVIDAVAGHPPGRIWTGEPAAPGAPPSLHQADIATVMATLTAVLPPGQVPPWELWGITAAPPDRLGEGLSPPVAAAVEELVRRLHRRLDDLSKGSELDF